MLARVVAANFVRPSIANIYPDRRLRENRNQRLHETTLRSEDGVETRVLTCLCLSHYSIKQVCKYCLWCIRCIDADINYNNKNV